MRIYLFKKENDEEVYYKIDDIETEYTLNFEKIKELSKLLLDSKLAGKELEIEVTVQDNSLDIYKTTLENVFKSINEDEDLYELYSENQKTENGKTSEQSSNNEEIVVEESDGSDDL